MFYIVWSPSRLRSNFLKNAIQWDASKRPPDVGSHCDDDLHVNFYVQFCYHLHSNDLWCFYNHIFCNYKLIRLSTLDSEA